MLSEGHNFEQALEDLAGFEKIWLIYWFDQNKNWKPKVLVPRGPAVKRGVFATRSPHRPNPIGLSLVDLVEIKGRNLLVTNVDLLDNTPILDIKPYLPYTDAYPHAKAGWVDELTSEREWSIEWLVQIDASKREALEAQLRMSLPMEFIVDPGSYTLPHPYKRIRAIGQDLYELALREQRVTFTVDDEVVKVKTIS